ncbi:type IV secretory system conjugative DNA transfer family protein [Mesoplasma coleopterae]|uniref:type IV secretory system conjugative DNA transfer family protein n=1 Tax=Mesoplasma coleopterae TaxID=324078 RepID=UPI000D04399F|nr:type IV secretory system conjugative DNA transfer family protein [Mesoplasma coleopterae]AVN62714.1 hypothetical protein CG000_00080 [Mesoplasma coleopterae]
MTKSIIILIAMWAIVGTIFGFWLATKKNVLGIFIAFISSFIFGGLLSFVVYKKAGNNHKLSDDVQSKNKIENKIEILDDSDFDANQNLILKTNNNLYGSSKFLIDEREKNVDKQQFNKFYKQNFDKPSYLTRVTVENDNLVYHGMPIKDAVHQIVIGSTGSGKTEKIVFPTIWTNAKLQDKINGKNEFENNKPSFVITDPKGEILNKTSSELIKQGYEVKTINFKETWKSISWNPLHNCYKYFEIALIYKSKNTSKYKIIDKNNSEFLETVMKNFCSSHTFKNCLDCLEDFRKSEKSIIFLDNFSSIIFYEENDFNNYLKAQIKKFRSLSFQEINDISEIIMSNTKNEDKMWENGAKDVIKGILLALLEIKEKNINAITEDNFNMYSVFRILSDQEKLKFWFNNFKNKNPNSEAWSICSNVISASEKTFSSFFATLSSGIRIFGDPSLKDVICKNDIDLFNVCNNDKPVAIFLIIPDDRKDKHVLASLFVSQLYLASTLTCTQNKQRLGYEKLDRDLMFILEEFGNMPAIANLDNILSVSRSRRMFFTLIVQDLEQINTQYAKFADTIKSNCLLTIYLKSDNMKINEEISKKCGVETVITKSYSSSQLNKNVWSTSMVSKKLLTESEVFQLTSEDDELAIVQFTGLNSSISRFKYHYRLEQQNMMIFDNTFKYSSSPRTFEFGPQNQINISEIY